MEMLHFGPLGFGLKEIVIALLAIWLIMAIIKRLVKFAILIGLLIAAVHFFQPVVTSALQLHKRF